MLNLFKKTSKTTEVKTYKVTYIDEVEITEVIDKKGLSNLIMSIDCVGGEILSVEEITK